MGSQSHGQAKKISPVGVTYTGNPADRGILIGDKLRLVLSDGGLAFQAENGDVRRQYVWDLVLDARPHPLDQPPYPEWEAPQLPRCGSCGSYYYPPEDSCGGCAILSLKDINGIYEHFHYGLHFSDPYYMQAFLKWTREFVSL